MSKIPDDQCVDHLKAVAVGRTAREMAPLLHAAHEAVMLEAERAKHADLISRRGSVMRRGALLLSTGQAQFDQTAWGDLAAHLGDGQGSNHIDVVLGLVWKAVLQCDQAELEMQKDALIKAAMLTFPHIRKVIEDELGIHP